MNVHHKPNIITHLAEVHYSDKDGVPVKYVCTTALDGSNRTYDVFHRNTPHPEFGNHYFGLRNINEVMHISNADVIEGLEFGMIESQEGWHYSAYRHDFIKIGDKIIDGGRAYTRGWGYEMFKVVDGKFVKETT
jgi:hypothetical protein